MGSHGCAALFAIGAPQLGADLNFTVAKARVGLQVIVIASFTAASHATSASCHFRCNSLLAMLLQQEMSQIGEMLLREVIFVQLALFQIEFYWLG